MPSDHAMKSYIRLHAGRVSAASAPIASMIPPRYLSGSAIRSIRLRTYSPPNARPKMNALSISSNECVELPSTRLSMRIQPSSYMNEAAPVRNAAITNHLATGSVTPDVADDAGVAGEGGGGSV